MAYAALVSLAQTIDQIINHDEYSISLQEEQEIRSIYEYVISWQAFLEDFPEQASSLEGRIRDLATDAEDVIEDFMSGQIRQYHSLNSTEESKSDEFSYHHNSNLTEESESDEFSYHHSSNLTEESESDEFSYHHQSGMCMWLKRNIGCVFVWLKRNISCFFVWFKVKISGMDPNSRFHFDFKKFKKVSEEIDSIKREVMEMKIGTTSAEQVKLSDSSEFATSSSNVAAPARKDVMVGFEDDLMEIKKRLCGQRSSLEVLPIFGMGGIGKTTLARNAFDDTLIVEHFPIRVWVTVSQDYSPQEILSTLLVSLKPERSGQTNELMAEHVYKNLKGRKYLIVMDDMWNTEAWDAIRMIFPDDNNGSRIILTTRLFDVAAYHNSSGPLHEMRFMDADQSWNLLKQKVFAQENCPLELQTIGKTIARSCRGLPLAIIVIAGLLSAVSKTQASWENIARNVNLAVSSTNDEQFAKILSLSYNHLPQHLRPCFLYMGSFPEDYEIRVSRLLKLWIAEGFLKPSGSKSGEEQAEEYLEDLVKRSLVLGAKRNTNSKITSCSLHDLVRDLCISKAREEKFLLHIMDRNVSKALRKSIKYQRRISIAHFDLNFLEKIYGSTVRTIICFQGSTSSLSYLRNFRLLRVLVVVNSYFPALVSFNELFNSDSELVYLPAEIFELFNLRYLAFEYPLVGVPAAISNLQNLQTLIIHPRKSSTSSQQCRVDLPWQIWRMPQLRHIVLSSGFLKHPEEATLALENLHTLSETTNIVLTESILKMVPNIKKLGISYSWHTHFEDDYHLENLVYLHQLEKLKLKIDKDFPYWKKLNPVFPRGLKKLVLSGLRLPWKDMGIVGSLPGLEVLKLRDSACFGQKWETTEGEFPELKYLLIEASYFQQWITESSHFPSLKSLVLYNCWYLRKIPNVIGDISTLELIEVDDRNESLVDSAKAIQQEQLEEWGNEDLQVRCVRYKRGRY